MTSSASNPGWVTTGSCNVSTTWRTSPICSRRMSGAFCRPALYVSTISWRNVFWGRSKVTMTCSGRWSRTRFNSIEVKPNTALVTWPEAVVMSVGRAKNAR